MENLPEKTEQILPATLGDLATAKVGNMVGEQVFGKEQWLDYKNQEIRAYFLGIEQRTNEETGELYEVAKFLSNTVGEFVASQSMILNAASRLEIGNAISITYVKDEKSSKNEGNYMSFDIRYLNVA